MTSKGTLSIFSFYSDGCAIPFSNHRVNLKIAITALYQSIALIKLDLTAEFKMVLQAYKDNFCVEGCL
jgi:hypothetical protein